MYQMQQQIYQQQMADHLLANQQRVMYQHIDMRMDFDFQSDIKSDIKLGGTLMELVNGCEKVECAVEDLSEVEVKVKELHELGFTTVANDLMLKVNIATKLRKICEYKYIRITPEKIKAFEDRKTREMMEKGSFFSIRFLETDISIYSGLPPANVLKILKEHKERCIFDYFTVAEVKMIKDLLLFGRITGVDDRFFITQWEEDIRLDDII